MNATRADQLRQRLDQVRSRIARACDEAGRDPSQITLIAVTKYHPAGDICELAQLGQTAIGESRDQEAGAKVSELPADIRAELQVHFVGQVQRNKARSIVRYADVVHSLDRARLVPALGKAAASALEAGERTSPLSVLIQVNLQESENDAGADASSGRGGAEPEQVPDLARAVLQWPSLVLRGVMAVAPLTGQSSRAAFERLAEISRGLQQSAPEARWISAGMSGDLEDAVAAGATHLRVGSAILGSRTQGR